MPLPHGLYDQYAKFSLKYKITEAIAKEEHRKELDESTAQGVYDTGGAHAEALNRNKLAQRKTLAEQITDKHGTVIEMFAGRGNLTNAVWKNHSDQNILVEYNPETVEKYTSKITDKTRTVIHTKSNLDFARENLPEIPANKITAIDFDAFGSVIPIMTETFNHFKPVKPLVVGITDGIGSNLVRVCRQKDTLKNRLLELGYFPLEKQGLTMPMFMLKVIKKTMEIFAKERNMECKRINGTHNRIWTVYTGFLFTPL